MRRAGFRTGEDDASDEPKQPRGTRGHSTVSKLPAELLEDVEELFRKGQTLDQITEYLKAREIGVSRSALGRYGKSFLELRKEMKVVREQVRALKEDAADSAGVNADDAALELSVQRMLQYLMSPSFDPSKSDPAKMMSALASLLKARPGLEKMKAEIAARATKAATETMTLLREAGISDETAASINEKILGIPK